MRTTSELFRLFNDYMASQRPNDGPKSLYEPYEYLLSIGGKRLRPLLVLMAYELYKKDAADVLSQAYAIELFHNFTLVHDDIMDAAALRRGSATVHTKYGTPSAILSGDVMLVYAYQHLAKNQTEKLPRLLTLFNAMAIGVCEGQQRDLDFETRGDVTSDEYIRMIEQKTALLLGSALEIGGLLAGASDEDRYNLKCFGINTGIAFQLLDDLLDAFGTEEEVGKTIGGDIAQNKKTILYLEAMGKGSDVQRERLNGLYTAVHASNDAKVSDAKQLFTDTGAVENVRALVEQYHAKAIACLDAVRVDKSFKSNLVEFSAMLMQRTR